MFRAVAHQDERIGVDVARRAVIVHHHPASVDRLDLVDIDLNRYVVHGSHFVPVDWWVRSCERVV